MRALCLSIALLAPASAFAQDKPSDDNVARADALFREAQALRDIDLNGACVKFAESYELNPHALGTLLNVALCDKKLGRLASALEKFTLARDIASETLAKGPDEAAAASRRAAVTHIEDLQPRIPHVTIEFVPPMLPDTTIVIDRKAYALDKLAKLAVDPGSHVIVVSAPGYLPYETTFAIAEGEHHNVAIPNLEKSVTVRSKRRTIGVIVGGAGALAGATGIVVGLVARSRYADVTTCDDNANTCDSPDDYTKRKNALSLGNVGTVVGLAGAGAIVVGAVLWYTGRKSSTESTQPRVTLLPHATPDGAGITAVGRF